MHSVPVPINVRCYSNSDIIVRRSDVTLRANKRHVQRDAGRDVCAEQLTTRAAQYLDEAAALERAQRENKFRPASLNRRGRALAMNM